MGRAWIGQRKKLNQVFQELKEKINGYIRDRELHDLAEIGPEPAMPAELQIYLLCKFWDVPLADGGLMDQPDLLMQMVTAAGLHYEAIMREKMEQKRAQDRFASRPYDLPV